MGFLDKLMFWKKDDNFSFPEKPTFGMDPGLGKGANHPLPEQNNSFGRSADPGLPDMNQGGNEWEKNQGGFPGSFENPAHSKPQSLDSSFREQPFQQPFQQQSPHQQPSQNTGDYMVSKNIEILSSKMDALRVGIESINQRLAHLERIAASGEHEQKRGW